MNRAVARSLRPVGQSRRHSSFDTLVAVESSQAAVEQSKWSSSTAAVTIRPPRLPALMEFRNALPSKRKRQVINRKNYRPNFLPRLYVTSAVADRQLSKSLQGIAVAHLVPNIVEIETECGE